MKIFGIIAVLLSLFGSCGVVYCKTKTNYLNKLNFKYTLITLGSFLGLTIIGTLLMVEGIALDKKYTFDFLRTFGLIIITIIFAFDFYYVITYLWIKGENSINLSEKVQKSLKISSIIGAWLLIPLLFGFLEIIVPIIDFPLPKNLITFSTSSDGTKRGIAFYAIFILIGAYVTYLCADKKMVKYGYKKGILEPLLYIAFPFGIIGARIWYVIAEWDDFVGQSFETIIAIWDGGIAIQGGILFGAAAGLIYMHFKHKEVSLLKGIDAVLPCILLAQVIGRWGNFFNYEVYGAEVARSSWSFLPSFILNQMSSGKEGFIYVPLFLIEGVANLAGYFLITYGIGKGLKKYIVPGDQGFAYMFYYGLVRFILEPLRDPKFIMNGIDGKAESRIMSAIFIAIGIIGIIVLHIIDYNNKKKKPQALSQTDLMESENVNQN